MLAEVTADYYMLKAQGNDCTKQTQVILCFKLYKDPAEQHGLKLICFEQLKFVFIEFQKEKQTVDLLKKLREEKRRVILVLRSLRENIAEDEVYCFLESCF